MAKINLEGRTIGLLEVLEKEESNPNSHRVMYKCKCQCGNVSAYERGRLLKGDFVACKTCRVEVVDKQVYEEMQTAVVNMFENEKNALAQERAIKGTRKQNNLPELSVEQNEFIDSALGGGNILVDACIGSGKTTAIQALCYSLPKTKRILYLTYNRLLKFDAQAKINRKNVTVTNYHGFAYSQLKRSGISAGVSDLVNTFNSVKPDIPHYDVLIIDEYQDIEQELADLLQIVKASNLEMQIIAVGDMQQKIYDKTTLDVVGFIDSFLGEYKKIEFTKCFRLSKDLAAMLGRIWNKRIEGVNSKCVVEQMTVDEVMLFLSRQNPSDILCLGSRNGNMSNVLNLLEEQYPDKYNKNTVYASIADNDSGASEPRKDSAIFTTYDSSKGLERTICIVFDFTEDYWGRRIDKPQQDYIILRNIFCVAASRGKSNIIFVKDKNEFLSEETLSTHYEKRNNLKRIYISGMFDFKYKESVESCYKLLQINKLVVNDTSVIEVKNTDGLIDLSPCIGIYQEASFFENYNIDADIDLYLEEHKEKQYLYNDDIRNASVEKKVLFLISLETNQKRYLDQVQIPFIKEEQKLQLKNRLGTVFNPLEEVQTECTIPFNFANGNNAFTAYGMLDVLKNDIVYELKFVSELKHEHFLQCACYMIAQNKEKGILWNVRDNSRYEICIPDKKVFLKEVGKTVSKNYIDITEVAEKIAVIDTETTWSNKVMSIGIAVANSNDYELVESRYYVISPEVFEDGMYSSVLHIKNQKVIEMTRENAIKDLIAFLIHNQITKLFAYNASFDKSHLPELSSFDWYDIMRIAAYKQYNSQIPDCLECTNSGRLKRGYGVESIMRMLSGDTTYIEIHNAEVDAIDELKIMRLLNRKFSDYENARISNRTKKKAVNTQSSNNMGRYDRIKDLEEKTCSVKSNETMSEVSSNNNRVENTTYSVADVSNMLGMSKNKVYNLIHDGSINAYKNGNKYVIEKKAVINYIEEQERRKKMDMIIAAIGCILLVLLLILLYKYFIN